MTVLKEGDDVLISLYNNDGQPYIYGTGVVFSMDSTLTHHARISVKVIDGTTKNISMPLKNLTRITPYKDPEWFI